MTNSIEMLFPISQRQLWSRVITYVDEIREIRIRAGKPVRIVTPGGELYPDAEGNLLKSSQKAYCMGMGEIEELLDHICRYSVYAFENELRQGYVTTAYGHRVGIVGHVILDHAGEVVSIRNITSMNIRIAHEVIGAAKEVLPKVYQGKSVRNTLIVSAPGGGKTTLLRDLVRQISNGNRYAEGMNVGLVDERGELSGCSREGIQNDVGSRTDVLYACPKKTGIMLLLRTMTPQVIAVDELDGVEELQAVKAAAACGCSVLATLHGKSVEDVKRRFPDSFWENFFTCYIFLEKEENGGIRICTNTSQPSVS